MACRGDLMAGRQNSYWGVAHDTHQGQSHGRTHAQFEQDSHQQQPCQAFHGAHDSEPDGALRTVEKKPREARALRGF